MAAYVAEIEQQVMESLDRADDIVQASLSGLRGVTEQIVRFLPELPVVPFAELIPAPREAVKASFNVADRILFAERRFADGVVDAIAPVTEKLMPWTVKSRRAGKPSEAKSTQTQRASEAA